MIEVRLLGPIEVWVDGRSARLGGPRPRALVAVLALSAGTAVPTQRLVELLWDGEPPRAAANAVQVYISRLRRALLPRSGAGALRAASGGYVLDIPPEAVDVRRFERLAATGHSQLAAGDPRSAAETLRSALAIWRGPAAPDLAGLAAGDAVVTRLEGLRASALADRLDADAALGRHAMIVPELAELVRLHPLDERLVAQLMTALYRSGRQADALAAYTAAAERLAEELGVDPGPDLRQLHREVLRQEVAPPVPAGAPAAPPTPEQPAAPVTPAGIPRPVTALIGRRDELSQASDLLGQPDVRLVTLLGPGGVGKTRLALAVADSLASVPDAGQVVVTSLAAVADPADLLPAICRAAGASPDWAGEPARDVAVRALRGRPVLLVLDNLEQLVAGEGALDGLVDLLGALPGLTVLATSRTALRLRGEHVLVLDPLPLPDPSADADITAVLEADAVRLFRERAAAALPGFEVTPVNAATVAAVCRMLDGLPLALELAAARVRLLPPEEMLTLVGDRLRLLTGGPRDLPERQRSVRATLDWSYHLLDRGEAVLFARLSVFAGGWTVEAAESVCPPAADEGPEDGARDGASDDGAGGADVLDVLDRLIDRSLVAADGSGRMAFLETVRQYAAEALAAGRAGDVAVVRDRHARYFAALAEQLGPRCRNSPDPLTRARLDAESGNLAAALEHAASNGDGELLARLVLGLLDYWFYTGRIELADRWVRMAQEAELPGRERARLLQSVGNLAFVAGDLGRAAPALAGAHAAAVDLGDRVLVARTLALLGVIERHAGHPERALARVEEALATARDAEATELVPALQNEQGELLDELGRGTEALPLWQDFRDWALGEGRDSRLAQALVNLALHAHEQGDAAASRQLIDAAVAAADRGGSGPVRADVLAAAGLLALRTGQARAAVPLLREAARLSHASGQLLTLADTVSLLGAAMLAADEPTAAARLLAAGAAWRAARGLSVVGRLVRQTLAEASEELPRRVPAAALAEAQAVGALAPYGSFGGLQALGVLAAGHVLDLRGEVIRLSPGPEGIPRPGGGVDLGEQEPERPESRPG